MGIWPHTYLGMDLADVGDIIAVSYTVEFPRVLSCKHRKLALNRLRREWRAISFGPMPRTASVPCTIEYFDTDFLKSVHGEREKRWN